MNKRFLTRSIFGTLVIFFVGVGIILIDIPDPQHRTRKNKKINVIRQIWALYYPNFGNPALDGDWVTWRYKAYKYSHSYIEPPINVPSLLFPQLGLYSCSDKAVIMQHFKMISDAGIDAVIVEWNGENGTFDNDLSQSFGFSNNVLNLMYEVAPQFDLKIGVQLPAYEKRTNDTIYTDIEYYLNTFGSSQSVLKIDGKPVIIIYDPHEVKSLWCTLESVRNSGKDVYFVATFSEKYHIAYASEDGFNAIFTYFASEGHTWSSNVTNWKQQKAEAKERNLHFIPAVAPGYNDKKAIVWPTNNIRSRESGKYYDKMWNSALNISPKIIAINSFNHWIHGTEIESALSKIGFEFTDESWAGEDASSNYYLQRTKYWSDVFKGFTPRS